MGGSSLSTHPTSPIFQHFFKKLSLFLEMLPEKKIKQLCAQFSKHSCLSPVLTSTQETQQGSTGTKLLSHLGNWGKETSIVGAT